MFTQPKISISDLVEEYEATLNRMSYSITLKLLFVRRAELMARQNLNAGLEYFTGQSLIIT